MATATRLGQAGLQGWREKVADGTSEPVGRRAPLDSEPGAPCFVVDNRAATGDWRVTRLGGSGLLTVAR